MKIHTTIAAFVCCCLISCNGQQKQQSLPANWVEYHIPNVCTFAIPPTLELRDSTSMFAKQLETIKHSSYWEWVCEECDLFNGNFNLIFQPRGLNIMNANTDDPYASYGRILVNFKRAEQEVTNVANEELLSGLSQKDKHDFNLYVEELYRTKLNCVDKFVPDYLEGEFQWFPMEFTQIDSITCLIIKYLRPGHNAQTKVTAYQFYKGDYFIEFILSCNRNNENEYKEYFDAFINYLHFEETFKNGEYAPQQTNKRSRYKSFAHNIQFEYDNQEFEITKIDNAPHMLLKLMSKKNAVGAIGLAAFDEYDYSAYNDIYNNDVVEYFREYDSQMNETQNGTTTTILSSCVKTIIGDKIKALRTISKVTNSMYHYTVYMVAYRYINGQEMQVLNVTLSTNDYCRFADIEQSITSGLSYITISDSLVETSSNTTSFQNYLDEVISFEYPNKYKVSTRFSDGAFYITCEPKDEETTYSILNIIYATNSNVVSIDNTTKLKKCDNMIHEMQDDIKEEFRAIFSKIEETKIGNINGRRTSFKGNLYGLKEIEGTVFAGISGDKIFLVVLQAENENLKSELEKITSSIKMKYN